jgi:hypothetical protein
VRTILYLTALLEIVIISPIPALDRWQEDYRAKMRAGLHDYLPENPSYMEEWALLREIDALPDMDYTRP